MIAPFVIYTCLVTSQYSTPAMPIYEQEQKVDGRNSA